MLAHKLPFENRWTSGEQAWQWSRELERIGLPTVRAMFVDHETHHSEQPVAVSDIPAGFVRDWLAYRDKRREGRAAMWRAAITAVCLIAVVLIALLVFRG
jgi:hypothetical protein